MGQRTFLTLWWISQAVNLFWRQRLKAGGGRGVAVLVGVHSLLVIFVVCCFQLKKAAFPGRCPGSRKKGAGAQLARWKVCLWEWAAYERPSWSCTEVLLMDLWQGGLHTLLLICFCSVVTVTSRSLEQWAQDGIRLFFTRMNVVALGSSSEAQPRICKIKFTEGLRTV